MDETLLFSINLMSNLLKSAINDYLGYEWSREEHHLSRDWLFQDFKETEKDKIEHASNGFVSFFTVCEALKVHHERLRVLIKCFFDQRKKRIVESQFEGMLESCKRI